MNNSFFKKNNKGIAMVTIMITIMFLSVIATALLYMSASNYSMKVANVYGKSNYYETDGILVKTSSAIRNQAALSANPNDLAGVIITAPTDSANGTYDISKIATLSGIGSVGSATATYAKIPIVSHDFTTSTGDVDYIEFTTHNNAIVKTTHPSVPGVTRYILKDIEITETSANGYKNSVKTDLIFDVHEASASGGSAGGVGNMSMLLDSPLSSTISNFKNLTMTGNSFVANYGTSESWEGTDYISPGTNGLYMTNESRLNLVGSNNVVYGDVNLSGNSTLCVYGNLTVYGDISIQGNASLIIADGAHLYQYTAGPLPGRTDASTISGADAEHVYPYPLTVEAVSIDDFKNFAQTIGIKKPASGPWEYGLIKKIFKKGPVDKSNNKPFGDIRVIDAPGATHGNITCNSAAAVDTTSPVTINNADFDRGRGYKLNNDLFGCKKFGLGFIGDDSSSVQPDGTMTLNQNDYLYRLMISYSVAPINLQQSTPFTTWISKSPVTCSQAHSVILSKVGTTQFNYMTAGKGDNQSTAYNNDTNPFNNISIKIGTHTFNGKFGALFDSQCNQYVDDMFSNSIPGGGSGGTPVYTTAISFDNFERDFDL